MHKYRAKPTTVDGVKFPSKKESVRWQQLQLLEKAGEIRNLKRQVAIPLIGQTAPLKTATGRAMRLTVDFSYEDKRLGWATVLEDSKGMVTKDFAVRRAVAEAMGLKITLT